MLHRPSGQAWRWAEGGDDALASFLRDELQLEYPACVTRPVPRPPLGQAGHSGVDCDEAGVAPLSECQGRLSPDGGYLAQQWGQPDWIKDRDYHLALHAAPSVVIADAETCEPLVRVAGAYAFETFWEGQWLSNSEGFVVGVQDG
ncbi:MAG: hypothetical protein F4Z25_06640, partial [Chloroflexi bacterium]|nr:hypothetical protein [Chloroflexota bacterium]